jgi:hypothetical protein
MAKKITNLAFEEYLFTLQSDILCAIKSYSIRRRLHFPSQGRHVVDFCHP